MGMTWEVICNNDGIRLFIFLIISSAGVLISYRNFKKHSIVKSKVTYPSQNVEITQKDNKRTAHTYFVAARNTVILIVATTISAYLCFFAFRLPISENPEHWGQMGDFFGGMLNPVLAFSSFLALLYTIRIQSDELELTRNELKASSQALSGQLLVQEQQKFESTFFNLISHLDTQIKLCLSHEQFRSDFNKTIAPREYILEVARYRPGNYCGFKGSDRWDKAYQSLQSFHHPVDKIASITHAILSLIQSQNFFNDTKLHRDLTIAGKKPLISEDFYLNILKAQINDDSMRLLVVWCHGEEPNKLKMLAEQYSLFDSIRFMKFPEDGDQAKPTDHAADNLIGWGLPFDKSNLRLAAFGKAKWPL